MKRIWWPEGSVCFGQEILVAWHCPHCGRAEWAGCVNIVIAAFVSAPWHFACPFNDCKSIVERFKEPAE